MNNSIIVANIEREIMTNELSVISDRVASYYAQVVGLGKSVTAQKMKVEPAGPESKHKFKVTRPNGQVEYTDTPPKDKGVSEKPVRKIKVDKKEPVRKIKVDKKKVREKVKEVTDKAKKREDEGVAEKIKEKGKAVGKGLGAIGAKIKESIKNAPAEVKKLVEDPEARKEASQKVVAGIRKTPKVIAKAIYESAKGELKSMKKAGQAVGKLTTGKKLDKEDKKALYATGVYVAGTVIGAMSGGAVVGAVALAHSFKLHVAIKAVHHMADEGFLHFEAMESAHQVFEVLEHISHVASVRQAKDEFSAEELEQMAISGMLVAVTKVLSDGISQDEMEQILNGEVGTLD